jgi:hypothetical protein
VRACRDFSAMLLLHARLSFLLRAVLLLASVSCAFRPVAAALQGPPQNVTVGVCVTSSGAPFQLETSRALAYGIHLTNLDYTVIPATDILIQEVDCGDGTYEMARDATKDLFVSDFHFRSQRLSRWFHHAGWTNALWLFAVLLFLRFLTLRCDLLRFLAFFPLRILIP